MDVVTVVVGFGLHFPSAPVPNPHQFDVALVVTVVVLFAIGDEEEDTTAVLEDGLHFPSRAVPKPQ